MGQFLFQRRGRLLLAVAVTCSAVLALTTGVARAASDSPSPAPSPSGQSEYRIGIPQDIDGINPFKDSSSITWEAVRLGYNFLTWYDQDWKPTPDAAEKWEVSPDGLTWTFHLRRDLKFNDGVPLTAKDVAFTYNLILETQAWMFIQYLTGVTKVTAPDDWTVVIETAKPNSGMQALYIPILPEHIWNKVDPAKLESFKNMPFVGSGPYTVSEISKSHYVRLKANPNYAPSLGGPPHQKSVLYVIYQNPDNMVADYKTGALDATVFFPPVTFQTLQTMKGNKSVAGTYIGFTQLSFNCWEDPKSKGNPLLRDVRIRQAVAWTIDKDKINQSANAGMAVPGSSLFAPDQPFWHWTPPADQAYTYDPAKARQILDQAGYIDSDGDGVREDAKGKELSFRFVGLTEYPEDLSAAKLIVDWCKDIGIKLRFETMTEGAFYGPFYDNANYDMFIWSWGGDVDPGFILSTYTTAQIMNNSMNQYSNPEYDQLFLDQQQALDVADPTDLSKRQAIVFEMQKIIYRDCPDIILWYGINYEAFRTDRWAGYSYAPSGKGGPFWNFTRTTYQDLQPASATVPTSEESNTGLIVAIVAAAIVVIGIVIWLMRRGRGGGPAEEA